MGITTKFDLTKSEPKLIFQFYLSRLLAIRKRSWRNLSSANCCILNVFFFGGNGGGVMLVLGSDRHKCSGNGGLGGGLGSLKI